MEVKDLECEQGTAKIQAILKHIRNDSAVGQTARILLRWAQIQAGTSKPILEDARDIPYIENDYILTLRHFMQQIKATLKEEDPWTVKTSRENDTHIMDEILDSPLIPATDYSTINYCRLYLQVTTIADITTSDGKRIRTEIMEGDRNESSRDYIMCGSSKKAARSPIMVVKLVLLSIDISTPRPIKWCGSVKKAAAGIK